MFSCCSAVGGSCVCGAPRSHGRVSSRSSWVGPRASRRSRCSFLSGRSCGGVPVPPAKPAQSRADANRAALSGNSIQLGLGVGTSIVNCLVLIFCFNDVRCGVLSRWNYFVISAVPTPSAPGKLCAAGARPTPPLPCPHMRLAAAGWRVHRDAIPAGDALASGTQAQRGASPAAPRSTPVSNCLGSAQVLRVVPPVGTCPLLSPAQAPAVTTSLRCHRALSVSRPPPRLAGVLSLSHVPP